MDLRAERFSALVLRALPYGESDQVVHMLARGRGRIAVFARGARSSKRRFGGALEPFQLCEILVSTKPGAQLLTLRESSVTEAHAGLRDDLHRLAHAGYASELAHELTREHEPADGIYAAILQFLETLSRSPATSARLRALELVFLGASGLAPTLDSCARCGEELPPGRAALDPSAGGLVCARCAPQGALALSRGVRALLEQLQDRGLAGADAPHSADGSGRPADAAAFEDVAAQASQLLAAFLLHQLGRAPRSAEFLRQVGAPV
jgi:DNA repair protein RecO (recombination protein O)